jgi:xylulokinase
VAGPYVIGLDIGTTSTIGILIRLPAKVVRVASRPVTLTSRQPGWAEEDPQTWWSNVCSITRELVETTGLEAGELAGIGVAGMTPALVLLDGGGNLLRPSIQQSDGRCGEEVDLLRGEIDERSFVDIAGNGITQQLIAAKLRWLERHEPAVFHRITTVLGSYDYINWRLTGSRTIEQNWALEGGLIDLRTHGLSDALLAHTHLAAGAFPRLARSTDIVGHVSAAAAAESGLPAGVPVVAGAADLIASALAAGLVRPGDGLLKFGGSIDVLVATDSPRPDRRMFLDYHLIPGLYVPNGCMSTGGSGLNWFANNFAAATKTAAAAVGMTMHQYLDRMAGEIPAGANGVRIIPYFLGEKTPIHDPSARGAITGLSLNHDIGHVWRALLEAYAYAIAHHLEVLSEMGHPFARIRACDGGAGSRVWMQIVADVIGKPVQLLTGHPGSCLGAAWVAAMGVGVADQWCGVENFVLEDELVFPNPSNAPTYAVGYRVFRETYRQLATVAWADWD